MKSDVMNEDESRKEEHKKSKSALIAAREASKEAYHDFAHNKGLHLITSAKLSTYFWNTLSLEANLALHQRKTINTCLIYHFKTYASVPESTIMQVKGDHMPYELFKS